MGSTLLWLALLCWLQESTSDRPRHIDLSQIEGSATVTHGSNKIAFPYAAAYQTKDNQRATFLVFSRKSIPFPALQQGIARGDEQFFFGDLFEFNSPGYLHIEVGDYIGFSYSVDGTGISQGIDNAKSTIRVEEGRIRGDLEMPPDDIFDQPFSFVATIDAAILTPTSSVSGSKEAPPLASENTWKIPVPAGATQLARSGSRYRKSHTAVVPSSPGEVIQFYREAYANQHYQQLPQKESDDTTLSLRSEDERIDVVASSTGSQTQLEVVHRDVALAKKEGVLPEAGQGRLILANAHKVAVEFQIGKTNYPLPAGRGGKDLRDALNYSVAPGTYTVSIKIPRRPRQVHQLKILADSSWAIVALPNGRYLPMQLF